MTVASGGRPISANGPKILRRNSRTHPDGVAETFISLISRILLPRCFGPICCELLFHGSFVALGRVILAVQRPMTSQRLD